MCVCVCVCVCDTGSFRDEKVHLCPLLLNNQEYSFVLCKHRKFEEDK